MARKILARHGTENIGTEKSWHGTARKKYHKIVFWGKIFLGRKIRDFLPGSKIPLLAIHKIISHIWEDRSRKVNNDEPDLRFFHGNFRPVISQAVRKPCFSTSIPRGPNLCILGPPTWARLGPNHLLLSIFNVAIGMHWKCNHSLV
mgnify:CR=1 FL=1